MSAALSPDSRPEQQSKSAVIDVALGCFTLLLGLTHVAYYFPRVVDDLFISLRYAHNLATGHGPIYNLGERVEGYSSPIWMLAQALGLWLGMEGVLWTKCLGVLCLSGLELALFVLSRRFFGLKGWLAWLPSLACALNSYVVNWAVLGLETPLHLLLVVACPWVLQAAFDNQQLNKQHPKHKLWTLAWTTLALSTLALSRPESPLYLVANCAAILLAIPSRAELSSTLRKCALALLPTGIVLTSFLTFRWLYYGYPVANTYFVKAVGRGLSPSNLQPLLGQGVGFAEAAVYGVGLCALAWHALSSRRFGVLLTVLGCGYFVLSVELDWMPSLRHLLPLTVLAPIGVAWLAQRAEAAPSTVRLLLKFTAVAAIALSAAGVASIDNRNSPAEKRHNSWLRPKSLSKWRDTLLAYRRLEPAHVAKMGEYEMGQITQLWHVLEASSAPIEQSWYIGRDIGAVGYYSDVNVFDTAGLVSAEVSHNRQYRHTRQVSPELIHYAMAKRPLAGEIYDGWDDALGKAPELLDGYRLRRGSPAHPAAFLAQDRPAPTPALVVQRYRDVVARFPQLFHLHTLYGESVGAAVEKRLRAIEGLELEDLGADNPEQE